MANQISTRTQEMLQNDTQFARALALFQQLSDDDQQVAIEELAKLADGELRPTP